MLGLDLNNSVNWGIGLVLLLFIISALSLRFMNNTDEINSSDLGNNDVHLAYVNQKVKSKKQIASAKLKKDISIANKAEEQGLIEMEESVKELKKTKDTNKRNNIISDLECSKAKIILAKCKKNSAKIIEKKESLEADIEAKKEIIDNAIREKKDKELELRDTNKIVKNVLSDEQEAINRSRRLINIQKNKNMNNNNSKKVLQNYMNRLFVMSGKKSNSKVESEEGDCANITSTIDCNNTSNCLWCAKKDSNNNWTGECNTIAEYDNKLCTNYKYTNRV